MQKEQEIMVFTDKKLTKSKVFVKQQDIRKYLTREQINEILIQIPAGKNKMVIQTLWMTGIRVSELINIKKQDIDFLNSRMIIQWLKNRKMKERIIPIHNQLKDILHLYCAGINQKDRVFPFTRQWIYQITKKYLKANPHILRHSFAVNFLEQSKSAKALIVLKELLGHRHINTTMEYLRIVPNDQAQELEKISFN